MTPNNTIQATIQTLNIPDHLTPGTRDWHHTVFWAATNAAHALMDEAENLPPAEFLRRYRAEYKPAIDNYNATANWAANKMQQDLQQNAA